MDTKLDSYKSLNEETVKTQRVRILEFLEDFGPISDRTIGKGLSLPINIVTARRNELVKLGKVAAIRKTYDPVTKTHVTLWGVVE